MSVSGNMLIFLAFFMIYRALNKVYSLELPTLVSDQSAYYFGYLVGHHALPIGLFLVGVLLLRKFYSRRALLIKR